jgi:hypothetical protein
LNKFWKDVRSSSTGRISSYGLWLSGLFFFLDEPSSWSPSAEERLDDGGVSVPLKNWVERGNGAAFELEGASLSSSLDSMTGLLDLRLALGDVLGDNVGKAAALRWAFNGFEECGETWGNGWAVRVGLDWGCEDGGEKCGKASGFDLTARLDLSRAEFFRESGLLETRLRIRSSWLLSVSTEKGGGSGLSFTAFLETERVFGRGVSSGSALARGCGGFAARDLVLPWLVPGASESSSEGAGRDLALGLGNGRDLAGSGLVDGALRDSSVIPFLLVIARFGGGDLACMRLDIVGFDAEGFEEDSAASVDLFFLKSGNVFGP